tara:strand:+ start:6384 stop:7292 length:909 start_codon:yes stop_codon:yes gene_type:complete
MKNKIELRLTDFIKNIRNKPGLYKFLKCSGCAFIFRHLGAIYYFLRFGKKKKIIIDGTPFTFAILDDTTRNFFHDPYWFGKLYEKDFTHHFIKSLENCKCFIDVGSNFGFFSIIAGKILDKQKGVVHAIEIDSDNINRMKSSVRLNHLDNITIHHKAVGDSSRLVDYFCRGSSTNTLKLANDKGLYRKRSIPMVSLDDLVEENKLKPDIIKIDIEGAEYLALLGMTKILNLNNIKIYCEVHLHKGDGSLSAFGHSINDVLKLLKKHGFTIEQIGHRQNCKITQQVVHDAKDIAESVMLYAHH